MAKKPDTSIPGIVLVDKPAGMTSHDVVSKMRRVAHTRKVGHGGTLDPMATGVLVIGIGQATRLLTYITRMMRKASRFRLPDANSWT